MCRSKANGGRRCAGRSANTNTNANSQNTSSENVSSSQEGTAPVDQVNIVTSGFTPMQVGRVVLHDDTPAAAPDTAAPAAAPPADGDTTTEPDEVRVVNIRSGRARVGFQADTVTGPIVIRM